MCRVQLWYLCQRRAGRANSKKCGRIISGRYGDKAGWLKTKKPGKGRWPTEFCVVKGTTGSAPRRA